MPSPNDITIGADPEFLALDKDVAIVGAGPTFGLDVSSAFGADGHNFLFELRPRASSDPLLVVESIRKSLLSKGMKLKSGSGISLKDLFWKAGGSGAPFLQTDAKTLGGHIHFGHNDLRSERKASHVATFFDHTILL